MATVTVRGRLVAALVTVACASDPTDVAQTKTDGGTRDGGVPGVETGAVSPAGTGGTSTSGGGTSASSGGTSALGGTYPRDAAADRGGRSPSSDSSASAGVPSDAALRDRALPDSAGQGGGTMDGAPSDASSPRDVRSVNDAPSATDARDVGTDSLSTADGARDGAGYCALEGGAPLPPHVYGVFCTRDVACNFDDPGFDPCAPSICDGLGDCRPAQWVGKVVPDNAPCDDGDSRSFAHPASGGCPSNRCVGGENDGAACTSDSSCPGGSCFMNRCVDGPNVGSPCGSNADCTGGQPNATCVPSNRTGAYCDGGAENGNACRLTCVGGLYDGLVCRRDGDCIGGGQTGVCAPKTNSSDCPPVGRCVRWKTDPATQTCTAVTSNPFCNTAADCPTTKYCALDTKNEKARLETCFNTADGCCDSGTSYGPCLVWDTCDTANHVCVRTRQGDRMTTCGPTTRYTYGDAPCGVTTGYSVGTVCNDVCVGGRCTSRFAECR